MLLWQRALALMSGMAVVVGAGDFVTAPSTYYYFMSQTNATLRLVTDTAAYPTNGACQGCYAWATTPWQRWTSGFLSGTLLKLYNYSVTNNLPGADYWLEQAILRNEALSLNQYNTDTHDVGFMVFTSIGQQYELTGNHTAKTITLNAAAALATRFSATVGCLQSWNTNHSPPTDLFRVIVDSMMNLELLWCEFTTIPNLTGSVNFVPRNRRRVFR